jgi:anti-sigma regulatory factor (Ser/Thr protein kinase)
VTIAAVPGQVGLVRGFVAWVLGESHPDTDVAVLLASELVTNSVLHSGSAVPGGTVTVTVAASECGIRVEVTDRSGTGTPVLLPAVPADGEAEGNRGMRLVDTLAARWGYRRGGGLTTTWFELPALLQPTHHSAVSGKTRPLGRRCLAAGGHAELLRRDLNYRGYRRPCCEAVKRSPGRAGCLRRYRRE